jgi:subtilisin family serine protease
VGSIDINYASNGKEQKASYSDSGPRIDIFSPGTAIVSTLSNVYSAGTAVGTYPYNSNFRIGNLSGTSMAAPNIAGIVAQLLQIYPGDTPAEILERLADLSTKDVLYDTGSRTDYSNLNTLHGSPNRYGYFPYEQSIGYFIATGAIQMLNVTINT